MCTPTRGRTKVFIGQEREGEGPFPPPCILWIRVWFRMEHSFGLDHVKDGQLLSFYWAGEGDWRGSSIYKLSPMRRLLKKIITN